MKTIYIAIRVT